MSSSQWRGSWIVGLVGLAPLAASMTPVEAVAAGGGRLKPPTLTCGDATQVSVDVKVCAGSSGAPAGSVLKWLEGDAQTPWPPTNDNACFSYFWSKGRGHYLAPGQCITVNIGELLATEASRTNCSALLQCGTTYTFRSWARETSTKARSTTATQYCSTLACTPPDEGCTLTQGYWDSHGPVPKGNNDYTWPEPPRTAGFMLGTVPYDPAELQSVLQQATKGNGLVSLARQLIAAKLNVANGADDSVIADAIEDADGLIGALVVPPVGNGMLTTDETEELRETLTQYNEGAIGPGHCSSSTTAQN
jgi:hypothetical protein